MLICMLAQVHVLLLTRFTFNKCNELYVLCVLPKDASVILSTCIAVVDNICIKSVRELSKFIRLK